ncbi:MAG: TspO/MBR family protein [Verrucomicrobiales bacterium]
MRFWQKALLCSLLCVFLGGASGLFGASSIGSWYAQLSRPAGTPPNAVFGPVWTTLYICIGVSFALMWHRVQPGSHRKQAMRLFIIQWCLNLSWTPLFFGARQLGFALVILLALVTALTLTVHHFYRLERTAGILLVPYLLWILYATYLNAGFWLLNR